MNTDDKLQQARGRIDAIDEQLQALITERALIAQDVARIKAAAGEGKDCYRPSREAEVLRRVRERNTGPLTGDEMVRVMREIMSACLSLESPLEVAYLGPEGTYTQGAVLKHFGKAVHPRPLAAINEIFRDVEAGNADYGVVPVENSTEGVVNHTLDMFSSSNTLICGEVSLPVHHHLLSVGAALDGITEVCAHSQSFAQCRQWLDRKLPHAERVVVSSNGEAARLAAERGVHTAAIAGKPAAERYGLGILAANIEDDPDNTTRFLVIGKQLVPPTGNDMTTILLSSHNRPGALYDMLRPFSDAGVNLTRIESRPSRRANWDYNFFVDIEGHADEPAISRVLQDMQRNVAFFKFLGSYPRAVT
ncbi:MAG: prephenate dehydratase [Oceanococcaceae bacterium]